VKKTHHYQALKNVLPGVSSGHTKDLGLAAILRVRKRWERVRTLVPEVASIVDETLARLEEETRDFTGYGLVASHKDICSANWLITADRKIFLIDLDAMSQDDPAHDLGSVLWWYFPPELRKSFLDNAGCILDNELQSRMRMWMAIHCLSILLPRLQSYDQFDADSFAERLIDFRAVVDGKENPRGYED